MAIELVEFSALAKLLGLSESSIASYPALSVIRDSVVSALENYTGREFEKKQRSETLYAIDAPIRMMGLKALPVISVASVTDEDGNALDYRRTGYGIELTAPAFDIIVSAIYTGGYAESALPEDLKRAALIQTAYEFQTKSHIGAETVSTEGGTVSRPALQILPEVKRIMDAYMHPLRW